MTYQELYKAAQAAHPGVMIAMRVGDFFEFYSDDAEVASSALNVTLVQKSRNDATPMCGVPYHRIERDLTYLMDQLGFKVATLLPAKPDLGEGGIYEERRL